jgi:hypothetical protein
MHADARRAMNRRARELEDVSSEVADLRATRRREASTIEAMSRVLGSVGKRSGEVHVVPRPQAATWGVYIDAVAEALSEHTSETAAESAAQAHAQTRGASRIVIHDRYHRTHVGAAPTAK